MFETSAARRRLVRRTLTALAVLVVAVLAAVLMLTLSIPLRHSSAPPVAEKTAIFVSPHPDDEAFAMGQTIATQDIEGVHTVGVLVTDGDSSSFVDWWVDERGEDLDTDGDIDRWDFGLARREEYVRALDVLGVDEVVFLGAADSQGESGFMDGSVDADDLEAALSELAEKYPDATWFTMAPYSAERIVKGDYKNHPDHAAAAAAVTDLASVRGEKAYLFKVYVYYMYPFARWAPVRVEGSAEALERKRAAVQEYSVIGGKSVPELFEAAPADEAEYMVPAFD